MLVPKFKATRSLFKIQWNQTILTYTTELDMAPKYNDAYIFQIQVHVTENC